MVCNLTRKNWDCHVAPLLAMGIILAKWIYNHIFTLTCWLHKILKLTQIKGFSMDDLKTFLPQMLKTFNFCIKKSLYDANLNITTVMVNSTFWVLCPQWQFIVWDCHGPCGRSQSDCVSINCQIENGKQTKHSTKKRVFKMLAHLNHSLKWEIFIKLFHIFELWHSLNDI